MLTGEPCILKVHIAYSNTVIWGTFSAVSVLLSAVKTMIRAFAASTSARRPACRTTAEQD